MCLGHHAKNNTHYIKEQWEYLLGKSRTSKYCCSCSKCMLQGDICMIQMKHRYNATKLHNWKQYTICWQWSSPKLVGKENEPFPPQYICDFGKHPRLNRKICIA